MRGSARCLDLSFLEATARDRAGDSDVWFLSKAFDGVSVRERESSRTRNLLDDFLKEALYKLLCCPL